MNSKTQQVVRFGIIAVIEVVTGLVAAAAFALVLGRGLAFGAEAYLALMSSVFAVPVALLSDVFTFPLWMWFLVAVTWTGNLIAHRRFVR